MEQENLRLLRDLLRGQRLMGLAVLVEGQPVAGLVPFLAEPRLDALTVHVSQLARHTKGLGAGAPWSAVIHLPDGPEVDPLQVPRLTVHGHSHRLEDRAAVAAVGERWLARFASAAMTLGLGDFSFFRLDLEGGRLVGGLAQARNLGRDHFAQAADL